MTKELSNGFTGIEVDGVRFSNLSEILQYMNKQNERIIALEKEVDLWKKASENNSYKAFQLEKENAELKETITKMNNVITKTFSNLTKAKEHIENLLYYVKQCTCERSNYAEIKKDIKEAEQFLKEVENGK